MAKKTLLIVDDSPVVRELVKNTVAKTGWFANILEADNGMDAIKVFFKGEVDFVITDVIMPKVDGYKLVATIKGSEAGKDVPVIMLSASRKEVVDKIRGLNIGASDYVLKPFDSSELLARINTFLKIQELQNELKEKNALLEKLSITDELTGLYNRRYFYDHINMHVALAKRHNYHIGCLLIDIDHFKNINDTFGHDVGDKALKGLAALMKGKMREGEVLARFGGEEFIICLCREDEKGAISAAERMRKAVAGANLSGDSGIPIKTTISIGIAIYPDKNLKTSDEIIKAADEALYHAKKSGRNKFVVYSESIELPKNQGGAL